MIKKQFDTFCGFAPLFFPEPLEKLRRNFSWSGFFSIPVEYVLYLIHSNLGSSVNFRGTPIPISGYWEATEDLRELRRHPNPIRYTNNTYYLKQMKKAMMLQLIPKIVSKIDSNTLIGIRDKAILLLGFALASRRSELVAIDIEDLQINDFGMDVRIHETKTKNDDLVKGVVFTHNEFCPVNATRNWIDAANITSGALFRSVDRHGNVKNRLSDKSIALIVKKYARELGLDDDDFSAHSLRSGLSTSAAMMGMTEIAIMKQTGHKTREMVDRYVQEGLRYKNNASSILKQL